MRRIRFQNMIRLPLLAALSLMMSLLSACSDHKDLPETTSPDTIYVSFCLYASGSGGSRAVDYDGTPEESYVDLENFKILIFDKDKKLKDVFYDNGDVPSNVTFKEVVDNEFTVNVSLPTDKYNTDSEFAIVALANWRSDPSDPKLTTDWKGHKLDKSEIGVLTITDLEEMTFSINPVVEGEQPDSWVPDPDNCKGIPMFGARYVKLKGYDPTVFSEGNPMMFPDISMVRALSKLEVINLDIAANRPSIESIHLTHRNCSGNLMQTWDFITTTNNVSAPTIRQNPEYSNTPIPFHREGDRFSIYVPEMEFGEEIEKRKAICINLDMYGESHQKWIYLSPYGDDGNPVLQSYFSGDWAWIKRNHMYRFSINSLAFEFLIDADSWIFGWNQHIQLK